MQQGSLLLRLARVACCCCLLLCSVASGWTIFGGAKKSFPKKSIEELKNDISRASTGTSNGLKASKEKKVAIQSAVDELIKQKPIRQTALSPENVGLWKLQYTTTNSTSAGQVGPFVGDVFQKVDADGLYTNIVQLGPFKGELVATWKVVNPTTWEVVFQDIAFSLFDVQLVKKQFPAGAVGIWNLQYLDDNYRVLLARGATRTFDNIYILKKVKP
jgi:hypothetical protein